jgi:hypothetical protein
LFSSTRNEIIFATDPKFKFQTNNLAVFVTHSARRLDQSDLDVLQELKDSKYFVCLVINSESSVKVDTDYEVDHLIVRNNIGFDLAAFRDALVFHQGDWDNVLLINDSIFWPSGNFSIALQQMQSLADPSTIVGLTDSNQRTYHLQSFCFLASGEASIANLTKVFQDMRNWHFKRSAVAFGELRITSRLKSEGSKISALFPYQNLVLEWDSQNTNLMDDQKISKLLRNEVPLNPTQHLWRVLRNQGGGFLKRSLLLKNPARFSREFLP